MREPVLSQVLQSETDMAATLPLSNRLLAPRRTPIDLLVYSTVRIECDYADGSRGTGTGFFFAFARRDPTWVPAIVTNRHVVDGAVHGQFHIHLRGTDGAPSIHQSEAFIVDDFRSHWMRHPDALVDLCVMPIAGILQQADVKGRGLAFAPLDMSLIPSDEALSDMTAFEEVLMVGYPNGIWDSVNNMPILRRGVTATHPGVAYEGRQEFMIDAACFPGSSGSPVLQYNPGGGFSARHGAFVVSQPHVKLLGILYAGPQHTVTGELQVVCMPTKNDLVAVSQIPNNLGVVIRSSRLREFEQHFLQLPQNPA